MVVFHSARKLDGSDATDRTSNIWRVNADGTGLTPLTTATTSGASSFYPRWSPDGSEVVFFSAPKLDESDPLIAYGTYNIWRVKADGTGLSPLTNVAATGASCVFPQWSPDGSEVVFHSARKLDGSDAQSANSTYNIWRVKADGKGLAPLTHGTVAASWFGLDFDIYAY